MSLHGHTEPAGGNRGGAARKANGAAAAVVSPRFAIASVIDVFEGDWLVKLSDTKTGVGSPFQIGIIARIKVDSLSNTATIEFPNSVFAPVNGATFKDGFLSYEENSISTNIVCFEGENFSTLAGISLAGDPEPVAVWAAEEG